MECIVCGEDSGGHRIVVTAEETELVGGFCHSCESAIFGACFELFQSEATDCCAICIQPGAYMFLDWLERTELDDQQRLGGVGASGAEDAPALCETHFQALTSESSSWSTPTPSTPGKSSK